MMIHVPVIVFCVIYIYIMIVINMQSITTMNEITVIIWCLIGNEEIFYCIVF
jgi:hypothetical protein